MIILRRYPTTLVKLTPEEQDEFIAAGNARTANNRRMGVKHRADSAKYAYASNDPIGFVGEGSAGRHYKCRIDDTLGEYNNVDLQIMEVRSSGRSDAQLPIKMSDIRRNKLHLPFLLAKVKLEQRTVEFVGWLPGWQALERPDNPKNEPGTKRYYADQQTWYVRPPYYTIASLEDYLGDDPMSKPPKPLWMPWDFDPRHPNTNRQFPYYVEDL